MRDYLGRKSWKFTDTAQSILMKNEMVLRCGVLSGLTLNLSAFQAFSSLAEAAYEAADVADDQEEPATYCLSSSFELIVQKLLETTDR